MCVKKNHHIQILNFKLKFNYVRNPKVKVTVIKRTIKTVSYQERPKRLMILKDLANGLIGYTYKKSMKHTKNKMALYIKVS